MRLVDANSIEKQIVGKYFSKKRNKDIMAKERKIINDILDLLRSSPVYTFERVVVPFTYAVNWHHVEDELPPRRTSVLCYFVYDNGCGAIAENQYFGRGKWLSSSDKVAYWTEMPELPEDIMRTIDDDDDEDFEFNEDEDGEGDDL